MGTLTSIYTPVKHANGEELVQICAEDFDHFAGWADGRGKFDIQGTWEVMSAWTTAQNAAYARAVQSAQENLGKSAVVTGQHKDGISRTITVRY